jgi:peptidoglycan/LPS O-acetylase OafA/YrhL
MRTSGTELTSTSPGGPRKDLHHAPGLDGIRGVAVAAIVAYHLGFADGGLLSVTVFFTLSGYLITSILLSSWKRTGGLDLKVFWLRRARRLLPALLLLLVVVLLASSVARPAKLAAYSRQAFSALVYMANWSTIARGDTYFNRFAGPGPFDHLWSLAIEEQFYAVWPVLLLGLLLLARRWRGSDPAPAGAHRAPIAVMIVTAALAVASALAMAFRYVPESMNNTRAYEGTDARVAPILVGCLTAMLFPLHEVREGGAGSRRRRIVLEILGAIATIVVVKVVLSTDEYSPFLYRGGESLVSVASAVLVVAAAQPGTWVGKAFGLAPFRWLGVRTYGVYLFHMPIVAFMPESTLEGRPIARALLQLAMILGLAAMSWTLLEDPIRRHGVLATFTRRRENIGAWVLARRWAGVMLLVPLAAAAFATWPLLSPASASENDIEATIAALQADTPDPGPRELMAAPASSTTTATPEEKRLLTSCTEVVHVGDSTSLGLMSPKYLPRPEDRLDAQYGSVGVKLFVAEISGGRAIVEKLNGNQSAYEIVAWKRAVGYKGCFVLALGIGDAATIRGNLAGLSQRIDWMMAASEGAPVLWTTTKSLLSKGPYQNAYLEGWNAALVKACTRHPAMRVYDWASEVRDDWYISDKIHPNDPGSKERAARIARALAIAFPKDGPAPKECLVRSSR